MIYKKKIKYILNIITLSIIFLTNYSLFWPGGNGKGSENQWQCPYYSTVMATTAMAESPSMPPRSTELYLPPAPKTATSRNSKSPRKTILSGKV
jgi:hypothetical protein